MTQWVCTFSAGNKVTSSTSKNLWGGKGANLIEMSSLGLPVPPGFIINTEVCTYFYKNEESYPQELKEQVTGALHLIEEAV